MPYAFCRRGMILTSAEALTGSGTARPRCQGEVGLREGESDLNHPGNRIGPDKVVRPTDGFVHAPQDPDENPVVPVPWWEIHPSIRCDFCLADNAR